MSMVYKGTNQKKNDPGYGSFSWLIDFINDNRLRGLFTLRGSSRVGIGKLDRFTIYPIRLVQGKGLKKQAAAVAGIQFNQKIATIGFAHISDNAGIDQINLNTAVEIAW